MRNRIDKLGVSEPEIRKQGSNQIVIQLAGVHDPAKAAELIGKTAQLEFYDLQADLTGPVGGHAGLRPVPDRDREPLQPARRPAGEGEDGHADRVLPVRQEQEADRRARPTRASASSTPKHPTVPKGGKVFAVPEKHRRHHLHADAPERVPAATRPIGTTYYYLFKYDPTNPDETKRIPEMTGGELKSSGHAGRLRPVRPAGRPPRVHLEGQPRFQRITRDALPARPPLEDAAAVRDRARPRHQVVPADRLHRPVALERDQRRRPDHEHRHVRRGEGPRDRPPDRRPAARVQADRALGRLGDARQGLAEAGEDGGARSACSSSRSSCSSSTASSA